MDEQTIAKFAIFTTFAVQMMKIGFKLKDAQVLLWLMFFGYAPPITYTFFSPEPLNRDIWLDTLVACTLNVTSAAGTYGLLTKTVELAEKARARRASRKRQTEPPEEPVEASEEPVRESHPEEPTQSTQSVFERFKRTPE